MEKILIRTTNPAKVSFAWKSATIARLKIVFYRKHLNLSLRNRYENHYR